MSQFAAAPNRGPLHLPGWPFWIANAVVVPIAAFWSTFALADWILARGPEWSVVVAILGVALVAGALYALVCWSHGTSPRKALAGYVLAAALTIPWGYTTLIGLLVISCETGNGCIS